MHTKKDIFVETNRELKCVMSYKYFPPSYNSHYSLLLFSLPLLLFSVANVHISLAYVECN